METVFYTFCAYLPIHLLAYLPFFDLLRFGKGWMAVTVAGNLCLHLLGVAWVIAIGRPELVMAVGGVMVPISLALYFLNIRLAPGKLLFTYMLLVNYQTIALGIAWFVAARMCHAAAWSWESGVICLVLFVLAWRPMYRLFRYAAQQVYRIDAPQLWRVIWLIPAMMSGVVIMLTSGGGEELGKEWPFLFARASLLLCVVVVYWVLVNSLEGIQKQAALQKQLNFEAYLLEVQIAEQKRYSRLMVEHTQQLRQQRHDLRHQLIAIRSLAGDQNPQLRAYIDSLVEAIPTAPQAYCENQAVNALVSHYDSQAQAQGVEVEIELTVPEHTGGITDGELCVIFGNLLENALEACGRMTEGRRFLHLQSTVHLELLTITLDNSFDGQLSAEHGRYRSRKRDAFGIGLSSVQSVAKAHQGDARFEAEGTVFHSAVYVKVSPRQNNDQEEMHDGEQNHLQTGGNPSI